MILAFLIGFYRASLTRFTPQCPNALSCSAYGLQVANLHGSLRGGRMAFRRVKACRAIAYATGVLGPGVDSCGD